MLWNIEKIMTNKFEFVQTAINDLLKKHVPITNETLLQDIGLDSLDIVELQMKYEETFNVELKDPSSPIITVADLLNAISE